MTRPVLDPVNFSTHDGLIKPRKSPGEDGASASLSKEPAFL